MGDFTPKLGSHIGRGLLTLSKTLDRVFGSAIGDILQRGAAGWQVLAPGTSSQVLTSGGPGALNSWQTPSAGGTTISNAGAWSGTSAYSVGQCVTNAGSAYLCYQSVSAPAGSPPSLDGSVEANLGNNVSSGSASLTTTVSTDLIVVCVFVGTQNTTVPSVSSITSSGLSFSKRSAFNGTDPGNVTHRIGVEIWTAQASATLVSQSIAVSLSTSVDSGFIVAFGVSGTNGPFDTSGTLPVNGTTSTLTLTTADAFDMILYLSASSTGTSGEQGAPSGFTTIFQGGNSAGVSNRGFGVYYDRVSVTQGGVPIGGSGGSGYLNMLDALTDTTTVNPPPSTDDTHWLSQGVVPVLYEHQVLGGL